MENIIDEKVKHQHDALLSVQIDPAGLLGAGLVVLTFERNKEKESYSFSNASLWDCLKKGLTLCDIVK